MPWTAWTDFEVGRQYPAIKRQWDPLQKNGTGGFTWLYPPDGRKHVVSRRDYVSGMVSLAPPGSSRSFDCVVIGAGVVGASVAQRLAPTTALQTVLITDEGWERLTQTPRELIEA